MAAVAELEIVNTYDPENPIPKISDEELRHRADIVKPLVRKEGSLWLIEEPNLINVSYIWDPVLTTKAPDLFEVSKIVTFHTYGYHGVFRPSIAEVLVQLPAGFEENIVAFELLGPNDVNDLNKNIEQLNKGYHVAIAMLYGKAT